MIVACLDLPAFPLQIVWRREPAARAHPVVVIDDDRPQGLVLWACEQARRAGVLVGQRYAHALSLCVGLRARLVPAPMIDEAIRELRTALAALSPRVEPGAAGSEGTFWLDGDGLARIFIGEAAWPMAIAKVIADHGYTGAVVVGYSRFATFAIARATRAGVTVSRSEADERRIASAVPLARLELAPKLRDALARLGVTTVGQMVRLPGGGILERFGREAHRLYQLAAGERWDPLVPVAAPVTPDERLQFDDDETNVDSLVFALTAPLDRLLDRLARQHRAVTTLHVELVLRHALGRLEQRVEDVVTAAPTLDRRSLVRLVHLRLTAGPPLAPVHAARLWADDVL
ncbi:MAG: DNA polymerase Y family protein, partial [Proteobacteria bacterium]|nr:DNA polymerase Y family protein [Pseudomonadota bacterium]